VDADVEGVKDAGNRTRLMRKMLEECHYLFFSQLF